VEMFMPPFPKTTHWGTNTAAFEKWMGEESDAALLYWAFNDGHIDLVADHAPFEFPLMETNEIGECFRYEPERDGIINHVLNAKDPEDLKHAMECVTQFQLGAEVAHAMENLVTRARMNEVKSWMEPDIVTIFKSRKHATY